MKKSRHSLQTKEEDKSSETDFNGEEISDLPDRVQNDGHKDVHWNEVKNVWTSEDFNKEVENIRKYKYQTETTELKNAMTELKNIIEGSN